MNFRHGNICEILYNENKALWRVVEWIGLGACDKCGKPAIDFIEHPKAKKKVCPLCLDQWRTDILPIMEQFKSDVDTPKYHEAWYAQFDKYFGEANKVQ